MTVHLVDLKLGHVHHVILFFGRFCTLNLLNTLHSDDIREWKCDTTQPGCPQICNNHFNPMSHIRFFNLLVSFIYKISWVVK